MILIEWLKRFKRTGDVQDWRHNRADMAWKEATILQGQGNFIKALAKWRQAASFEEEASHQRPYELSQIYNQIGHCCRQIGHYEASRHSYERAMALHEKISRRNDPGIALILNGYALLLMETGERVRSTKLLKRSLNILESHFGDDNPNLASILNSSARTHLLIGEHEKAQTFLARAIDIERRMMAPSSPEVVISQNLMAELSLALGDRAGAERYYRTVLRMKEEMYGPEHPHVVSALYNLQKFFVDIDEDQRAETMCNRSLAILEHHYGRDHPFIGVFLNHLGWLRARAGDLETVRDCFDRARPLFTHADADPLERLKFFFNDAVLELRMKRSERAVSQLGLALIHAIQGFQSGSTWWIYHALSLHLSRRGAEEKAIFFAKLAIDDRLRSGTMEGTRQQRERSRWLLPLDPPLTRHLHHLLHARRRHGEVQALHALFAQPSRRRNHLFDKVIDHLKGLWVHTPAEKRWLEGFEQWRQRVLQQGEKEETDQPHRPAVAGVGAADMPPEADSPEDLQMELHRSLLAD